MEWNVLRVIAALGLASAATVASAASSNIPALDSTAPWWEKVTVTIAGDGQPQACRFESSVSPDAAKDCEVAASPAAVSKTATGSKDSYTRITFERRFSPEWAPQGNEAPAGDTLLGRQVLSLALGSKGQVEGCQIVSASGDMKPAYGCKEASAERFQASAPTSGTTRQVYMAILVYGHSEHVV